MRRWPAVLLLLLSVHAFVAQEPERVGCAPAKWRLPEATTASQQELAEEKDRGPSRLEVSNQAGARASRVVG